MANLWYLPESAGGAEANTRAWDGWPRQSRLSVTLGVGIIPALVNYDKTLLYSLVGPRVVNASVSIRLELNDPALIRA